MMQQKTEVSILLMMKCSISKENIKFLPPAIKFIKKIKDNKLKNEIQNAIDEICKDYTIGELKKGDLAGIYCYDVYYNKINYEIAYRVYGDTVTILVVIMVGTRENFYDELKKYLN